MALLGSFAGINRGSVGQAVTSVTCTWHDPGKVSQNARRLPERKNSSHCRCVLGRLVKRDAYTNVKLNLLISLGGN